MASSYAKGRELHYVARPLAGSLASQSLQFDETTPAGEASFKLRGPC
ncbi:MAG: hypothetical protein JRN61_04710 [Nitrososphaerota archaeon]|nr:hypothetical protein [Nitrososphaerota archaeon]